MQHTFTTPDPVRLEASLGSGDLTIEASADGETVVDLTGHRADEVEVDHRGDVVTITVPRTPLGFGTESHRVSARVRVPAHSEVQVRTKSADVVSRGTVGKAQLVSGSGDVTVETVDGDAVVEVGSGDVVVGHVTGHARVKSGSGTVRLDRVDGTVGCSCGSGDVTLGRTASDVSLKSGSGDLRVKEAAGDLTLVVASGDLVVDRIVKGRLKATAVSGDLRIGVPAGVPVWTDISTVTGSVRSDLRGAGRPAPGQDHVEIRASSVSGDVNLHELA